ncbi:MAG: serine/threonine protein kinase [Lysobacter sp.]|nr:serine/threonine protein kinase [Lysobacter sp.]
MRDGNDEAAREARLFDALCELEPAPRDARLDEIAREDAALAARLRRLLAIDADYAEHTARSVTPDDWPDPSRRATEGDDIGAFRLARRIGRGGMGVVYLAERRSDFAQTVAIKLMPRFAIDAQSRERFARERRLLAQLRHPNICSIVDGGELEDGTPWLAMEYVRGETLCAWCAQRAASLRERIDLFLQLCDAVQYAHNRLVIHRDLKDSNVLIETLGDGRATVKLLDFGIAKSLETTGDNARTALHELAFSPLTAAPEQIRGEHATVGADVYALGGLLHQLLCGVLPFASVGRDPAALQRAILDVVPPIMSETLRRERAAGRALGDAQASQALRGELDAIVAHSLRKAPEERYPDVGALARDLRAWRAGHPISISGGDRLYRLRKFLRRNRAPVALATVATASVLIALGVALWQSAQLRTQRDAAQTARARSEIDRDRARAVAGFVRDTFRDADPNKAAEGGLLARELIERGRRKLDRLDAQPDVQAELAVLLAESYAGQGSIAESDALMRRYAGGIGALAVGDADVRWRAQALNAANRLVLAPDSRALDADLDALARAAQGAERQTEVARLRSRLSARRSRFRESAAVLESAWRSYSASLNADQALRLRIDLADALLSAGRRDDARAICSRIDIDALAGFDPALQIRALRLLARERKRRGDDPASLARIIERWQRTAESLYGERSLEAASAYVWSVGVSTDPAEQNALMDKAFAIQRDKLPPLSLARAYAEFNMGMFHVDLRARHDLGEPFLARAVDIGRATASRGHADVRRFELEWALALNALGRYRECLERLAGPPATAEDIDDTELLSRLHLELARAANALGATNAARASVAAVRALWPANVPMNGPTMPPSIAAALSAQDDAIARTRRTPRRHGIPDER